MNILALRDDAVEFIGFGALTADGIITVRILADKLVINLGDVKTEVGKFHVRLCEKKSSDLNLCALFHHYCRGSPTTFIASKVDMTEYVQNQTLTEDEFRTIKANL